MASDLELRIAFDTDLDSEDMANVLERIECYVEAAAGELGVGADTEARWTDA